MVVFTQKAQSSGQTEGQVRPEIYLENDKKQLIMIGKEKGDPRMSGRTDKNNYFYISNKMTIRLEHMIDTMDSLEEFEKKFPAEFLTDDAHIGNYLSELLWKYDKKASVVSRDAMLAQSCVGNVINGKKRNPSRDALLAICLTICTSLEEAQ